MDFGVIINSPTCRYHLDYFRHSNTKEWSIYEDHSYFLNFNHKKNVAVLHWPYPSDPNFGNMVNEIYDKCDRLFIIITEVHQTSLQFMQLFDREKITFYIAGFLPTPLEHAKVKEYHDWFNTTCYFYKEYLPEIVSRIKYSEPKKQYFDALLGRKKPHRDAVYRYMHERLDREQHIVRYFNTYDAFVKEDDTRWSFEYPGLKKHETLSWTVDHVEYYGHVMSVSQIVPIDIYNRTAYSVVAETNWASDYIFYTEKTVKPIIGKRLFVMFGGRHYLKFLREKMGFLTFDGIIDESYDNEEDDDIRFLKACKQIDWLSKQDQVEILDKVKPIVEHNFNQLMRRNWRQEFLTSLEEDIIEYLQQT